MLLGGVDIYELPPSKQVELIAMLKHRSTDSGHKDSILGMTARDAVQLWNEAHPAPPETEAKGPGLLAKMFGL